MNKLILNNIIQKLYYKMTSIVSKIATKTIDNVFIPFENMVNKVIGTLLNDEVLQNKDKLKEKEEENNKDSDKLNKDNVMELTSNSIISARKLHPIIKKSKYNDPEKEYANIDRKKFYETLNNEISVKEFSDFIKPRKNHQWSSYSYNIIDSSTACRNDCVYCYIKPMNIRFGRVQDIEDVFRCDMRKVNKGWRKTDERKVYMFPTSHDIFPENMKNYVEVCKKIMNAKNKIVCVSKPRLECVKFICEELSKYKKKFKFRFTISTNNNDIIKLWEPNATSYEERVECLKYAYEKGFKTSISMEPFLSDPIKVIEDCEKYVKDKIWLGTMSDLKKMKIEKSEITKLENLYSKRSIKEIINKIMNLDCKDKIYYKNSFMLIAVK